MMSQNRKDDHIKYALEQRPGYNSFDEMELSKQTKLAKQTHTDAQTNGQTCIDCHKGIAHNLPDMSKVAPGWLQGAEAKPEASKDKK